MADIEKKTYLVNIESNLKMYAEEAVKAKEKVDKLSESNKELKDSGKASKAEIEASNAALRDAAKEYNQAKKMVDLQTAANNSEVGSRKQLEHVLRLQMFEMGKLKDAYITNAQGMRELNPKYIELRNKIAATKDEIIKYDLALNDGRSNIGRYGESVRTALTQVGGAFRDVTGAVGGTVGAVGDAIGSFIAAPGAMGAIIGGLQLLAKAWKTTQENIELYLKSADKVSAGSAAFEFDTEKALDDARKRARGQRAEGERVMMKANDRLFQFAQKLTEEEKEKLRLQSESGRQMRDNAIQYLQALNTEEERTKWRVKYNQLIFEEEKLNDERLAKESEWEGLEAQLIKQRAIVSDQTSTMADKLKASAEADRIADVLVKSKTELIDRQRINLQAIADMTVTQEVHEGKINAFLKERNTVEKEYYGDQVKINRLKRMSGTPEAEEFKKQNADWIQESANMINSELNWAETLKNTKIEKKKEELKFNEEYYAEQKKRADQAREHEQQLTDLYIYDQELKRNAATESLYAMSSIIGEQTEAGKMFAAAAATIDTYGAANKALNDPTIPSTIARIALMAGILLKGFANVKQIYAVKIGKGAGSAGAPTSIASVPMAQRMMAGQVAPSIFTQSQMSQTQLNAIPAAGQLTVEQLTEAFKNLPAPVTTIEDINARQSSTNKIVSRATI